MKKLEKEIRSQPQVLRGLRSLNDDEINKILDRVEKRQNRIRVFAARGTSGPRLTYRSICFGIIPACPARWPPPGGVALRRELDLRARWFIGVSQSGRPRTSSRL